MSQASADDDVHPFRLFNRAKAGVYDEDRMHLECRCHLTTAKNCKYFSSSKKNKTEESNCDCIAFLGDISNSHERELVSNFMLMYYNMKRTDQQLLVMQWIKYSAASSEKRKFFLPIYRDRIPTCPNARRDLLEIAEELSEYKICNSALAFILDENKGKWKTCSDAVKAGTIPKHKNKDSVGGRAMIFEKKIKGDLHKHFEELKELCEPQSTRVVRDMAGVALRDGEDDQLMLPPHLSKRKVYEQFCLKRGHVMTATTKGYVATKKPNTPDEERKEICSWPAFQGFWKKEYPHIKLGRCAEDICTTCHLFRHRFDAYMNRNRGKEAQQPEKEDALIVLDEEYDEEVLQCNSIGHYYKRKTKDDDTQQQQECNTEDAFAPIEIEEDGEAEYVKLLKDAEHHVKHAASQRKECNKKVAECEEDFAAKREHKDFRRCIIVDYSQNIGLPQTGDKQPGQTYYMSPLKVNVFGIVNCGLPGGTLDAFVYHEGQGLKGGDNVASLIMLFLEKSNWLQDTPGKELTVIMDNCPGQNKNNTVIRLANYLVEAKYFVTVNMLFYVAGHTKNACDRWFNTLKRKYRLSDIWDMDMLKTALETNKRITVNTITEGDFKEYSKWLDLFYHKIKGQGRWIKDTHNFSVTIPTAGEPLCMKLVKDLLPKTQAERLERELIQQVVLERKDLGDGETRLSLLKSKSELRILLDPLIQPIKQVELYRKWRKIVPQKHWPMICPKPPDEILEEFDKETKAKAKKKRGAAKKTKRAVTTEMRKKLLSPKSTKYPRRTPTPEKRKSASISSSSTDIGSPLPASRIDESNSTFAAPPATATETDPGLATNLTDI